MNVQLQLFDVSLAYGKHRVVNKVNFAVSRGELASLIGPSGCGKSTLLRAIAGFEPLTAGRIELHGRLVSSRHHSLPPERRKVGMVFQDFALFPHLSIGDNIAFGLRQLSAGARKVRISELLESVGLPGIQHHYPHQLSGGQQQRIALARALAPRPEILLLDEPFSSLDAELREQLALDLRASLRREGVTGLMVTHDQEEALTVSDHIGVIHQGQLLQWDTPYGIYHTPSHRFVAEFIGRGVFAPAIAVNDQEVETELGRFTANRPLPPDCPELDVLLRPDDIMASSEGRIRATITERRYHGGEYLYSLRLAGGTRLLCTTPSHFTLEPGDEIGLTPALREVIVFPRSTPQAEVRT